MHTRALTPACIPERGIEPLSVGPPTSGARTHYLHSSPEAAMKRLLVAGSGAIFQLCPVFRANERGRWHRPEFYMLEWYRPGWDERALEREVAELLGSLLGIVDYGVVRYKDIWQTHLGVDPHTSDLATLRACVRTRARGAVDGLSERSDLVQYLYVDAIEPHLVKEEMVFVRDYPLCESPLAAPREDEDGCLVAARFELYVRGVELANGNRELADAALLRERLQALKTTAPVDDAFIGAMQAGLPECSGVALGFDRLLALALGDASLAEDIYGDAGAGPD